MTKIQSKKQKRICKQCGAPITTEICPYCGTVTGIDTQTAYMEYPELVCNEAHISFWSVAFPAIFAVSFGWFGFFMPIFFYKIGELEDGWVLLFFIPFAAVGISSTYIVIKRVWDYVSVSLRGKEITGTVYGYMDDDVAYNGVPGQVCKILVQTNSGPRFIMYQLGATSKPHKINSTLTLKVYKDRFKIIDTHKYDAWK